MKKLLNELYQRYPQGFYVNTEQRMKDARGATKYIGRYLARPAIAEYRVVSYDYHKVHYWYEEHGTGKRVDVVSPVMKFIFDLVQRISPKHFRIVGRYGLYSRGKTKSRRKLASKFIQLTRRVSLFCDCVNNITYLYPAIILFELKFNLSQLSVHLKCHASHLNILH